MLSKPQFPLPNELVFHSHLLFILLTFMLLWYKDRWWYTKKNVKRMKTQQNQQNENWNVLRKIKKNKKWKYEEDKDFFVCFILFIVEWRAWKFNNCGWELSIENQNKEEINCCKKNTTQKVVKCSFLFHSTAGGHS